MNSRITWLQFGSWFSKTKAPTARRMRLSDDATKLLLADPDDEEDEDEVSIAPSLVAVEF